MLTLQLTNYEAKNLLAAIETSDHALFADYTVVTNPKIVRRALETKREELRTMAAIIESKLKEVKKK